MNTDYLVRRVCPYLRGAPDECLGCPATEDSSYGPGTRACRSLAESVIGIVSASQADTIESLQRELAEAVGDIAKLKQSLAIEVTESERQPRKPREWLIHEHAHNGVMLAVNAHGPPKGSCCIRVVEWPNDAPLPDWPEGYP